MFRSQINYDGGRSRRLAPAEEQKLLRMGRIYFCEECTQMAEKDGFEGVRIFHEKSQNPEFG